MTEQLIVNHLSTLALAVQNKSASGRGSGKNIDLYGIKKLRELILELAVRGKLVAQNPEDEPASKLLERIQAEKKKLVEEKQIKKPKELPEITCEEKSFELPLKWSWCRLDDVTLHSEAGWSPKCNDTARSGDQWGVLKVSAVTWGEYKASENKQLPQHLEPRPEYEVNAGDFLISRANTAELVARSVVVPAFTPAKLMMSDKIIRFAFSKAVYPDYLSLVNNSPASRLYYSTVAGGTSSSMKNVSRNQIQMLTVALPPLAEQHRIVAKVDELMALCDQIERQTEASLSAHTTLVENLLTTLASSADAEELKQNWQRIASHFTTLFPPDARGEVSIDQLKQTILQLAVMGKLVPQDPNDEPAAKLLERIAAEKARLVKEGKIKKQKPLPPIAEDEKPFELPDGWEFSHMQDICELTTDGTHLTPKYTESGRPFVSAQCVKPFKLMPDKCRFVSEEHYQDYIKNRKPAFRDILLSRVGAGIGEAALIDTHLEFAIYVSTCLLKPFKEFIHPEYLVLWLNSPVGRHYSEKNTYGKGVSQGNLNLSLIRAFAVSVSPILEQKRIVAKVNQLMSLCDQIKTHLQHQQQTRLHLADAMVEQALT